MSLNVLDCLPVHELKEFMLSKQAKVSTFQIRKKSGKEIKVKLEKSDMDVQENVIKSFVLESDSLDLGYVYLPSFYTDYEMGGTTAEGCANDLATELLRLKRDGIEGLILDLRDNGGGSMREAIKVVGISINQGALGIFKTQNENPLTLKDLNRGTLYADPMIIIVNSFSASASELFAAAMQDHNRALIVGTKTYGKSTAQSVIPLDTSLITDIMQGENLDEKDIDFIKITHSTFFRTTGESHQAEGIIPDIYIPHIFEKLKLKEEHYPSVLARERIDKKTY